MGGTRPPSTDPHTLCCTQQQRQPSRGHQSRLPAWGSAAPAQQRVRDHSQADLGTTCCPCGAPFLTHQRHTRYGQPIPWPPLPKSHPIDSALTTSWLNTAQQIASGGNFKAPAVRHVSSMREQDAYALTAIPFSFCQQLVVELHSSINCSAASTQNPFSSGHW